MNTVTNKIGEIRRKKGLTQAALASKSKLSANFISLIERGEKNPSLRTLAVIARSLNVSTGSLLGEDLRSELQDLTTRYNVQQLMEVLRELIEEEKPSSYLQSSGKRSRIYEGKKAR